MEFISPHFQLNLDEGVQLSLRTGQPLYQGTMIDGVLTPAPETDDAEALRLLFQALLRDGDFSMALPHQTPQAHALTSALITAGAEMIGGQLRVTSQSMERANRAKGCKGAAWLERPLPSVHVAAIALIDGQDRVLLAQRPAGKSFAGLWEFPGGKIEPGESPELALCREVRRLGLTIWNSCLSPLTFVSHVYADFHLTLLAYACMKFEGTPRGRKARI